MNWNKHHLKTEQLNALKPYLDFLIDPSFQGANRLFVLPFNAVDNKTRHSRYSVPTVKVEDYNVIIDGKNYWNYWEKNTINLKGSNNGLIFFIIEEVKETILDFS